MINVADNNEEIKAKREAERESDRKTCIDTNKSIRCVYERMMTYSVF